MNAPLATLRQLTRKRAPIEQCEMCSLQLGEQHQHLIDPERRKLLCVCNACAILFTTGEGTKLRRVPADARFLPKFRMSEEQWNALMIPIGLAFFFISTPRNRVVAFYPSPAGATESLLEIPAWDDVVSENPVLAEMTPDVEALLVNRVGITRGTPAEYYIAPIDECYKLAGLIRTHWRGFSGGAEMWGEIAGFFAALKRKADVFGEARHA